MSYSSLARCWVSAGSAPTGTITVKRGGVSVLQILPGFGQSQVARWTVPTVVDGVTYAGCYLKELHIEVGASDKCNLSLVAKTPTDVMPRVKKILRQYSRPNR